MTSECFVHIWLPGGTEAVPCGRFVIEADRQGIPRGRFIYGRSYLARAEALPLDPVELALSDRTYETYLLSGVFGALRDAGPDFWGRRVIERHAGAARLEEIDYLLESPDDRAGALGFGRDAAPPAPRRRFNTTLDLARLQEVADAIIRDEAVDARDPDAVGQRVQVEDLLLMGTSMGGARPKAVISDAGELWIAKFNRRDDRWNNTRVEHAMLSLARAAGITVADSRIVDIAGRDVLLVKRFDRFAVENGFERARMVSGLTLLKTDNMPDGRARWSYPMLVEELRRAVEQPKAGAQELYRRIAFNALISNTDDHPRNHAIIAKGAAWKLSPAYDLTPSPHISEEQRDLALIAGGYGRGANAANLLSEAGRFLLKPGEAAHIIDDMEALVRARWYEVARTAGVSERDCATIARAFVYPGFRLPPAAP